MSESDDLRIDCDSCAVRDLQCGQCVVTVLLGLPTPARQLDDAERVALAVLADGGLVPPLRLVVSTDVGTTAQLRSESPDVAAPQAECLATQSEGREQSEVSVDLGRARVRQKLTDGASQIARGRAVS